MRRTVAHAACVIVAAVSCTMFGACAGGAVREPTLPSTNFSPKLVIEVRGGGLAFLPGPREDPGVIVDPPTVPGGTVVDVINRDGRDHRLQSGSAIDTGTLRPGEQTTVVLVNDTTDDKRLDLSDPGDDLIRGTITVKPRARN